ncbi:hypothetical protein [Endozoicomonas sp. ALC066]|uniref:hypothetical protein n=1 Tax=Endozoicomonas sp. ALC066 TaxID=3403078 RepID=UPI003BB80022
MKNQIKWEMPVGKIPEGWVERVALVDGWFISVWLSSGGFYSCSLMNAEVRHKIRIDASDLDSACEEAARKCLARIKKSESA